MHIYLYIYIYAYLFIGLWCIAPLVDHNSNRGIQSLRMGNHPWGLDLVPYKRSVVYEAGFQTVCNNSFDPSSTVLICSLWACYRFSIYIYIKYTFISIPKNKCSSFTKSKIYTPTPSKPFLPLSNKF